MPIVDSAKIYYYGAIMSENGIREAIVNLKEDVAEIRDRLHCIEVGGCPMGKDLQKQITNMQSELQYISRMVMGTSAMLAVLIIAIQIVIKFI